MGLFSTHTRTEKTTHVPYEKSVTVHEHRAPTDESVNILNEMEEKARQNIVRKIFVHDNIVNGVVLEFFHQETSSRIMTFKFKVNGQDVIFDLKRSDYERAMDKREIVDHLLKAACEELILQVVHRTLAEHIYSPKI